MLDARSTGTISFWNWNNYGEKEVGKLDHKLTAEQELHLKTLKSEFERAVDAKFRAGAAEHGGDLRDNSAIALIDYALSENIDQFTYLMTARQQLVEAKESFISHNATDKCVASVLFGVHE